MKRSVTYLRVSASLREYLWTSPGDRWLCMWQQKASETRHVQITTFAVHHQRFWRNQSLDDVSVASSSHHLIVSSPKDRW
jgi:hypothetical protein